jgi:molecular chaperone DnaK (HSP70)
VSEVDILGIDLGTTNSAIAFDDSSLDFLDNAKLQQAFQEAELIAIPKQLVCGWRNLKTSQKPIF